MIKGAQRSIIVLKTPAGKYFEQAYFIVKDGVENRKNLKKDMVKEASTIAMQAISDVSDEQVLPKKQGVYYLVFFALGMFVCALICACLLWQCT